MKVRDAIKLANEFNETGKWREEWFYYPAFHSHHDGWFVVRRRKRAEIWIAAFIDGSRRVTEDTE